VPPPDIPWWLDLLGGLGAVAVGGGLGAAPLFGMRAAAPWAARWLLPAIGRIGGAAAWEGMTGRDPLIGGAIQALTEPLAAPVALVQRAGPLGTRAAARAEREAARAAIPEAERAAREAQRAIREEATREVGRVAERARETRARLTEQLREAGVTAEDILRNIGERARRAISWWGEELPEGVEAGRAILTTPKGREILSRRYGEVLREAADALKGRPVALPGDVAKVVAKDALLIDAQGRAVRVPIGTLWGQPRAAEMITVDAADAVRGLSRLPADQRYVVLRHLDRAIGDLPELAALQEARRTFREGVRLLDFLWSASRRAPEKLVGAPSAAEAIEALQRQYGVGPLAVQPKPWERVSAQAQQQELAARRALEKLPERTQAEVRELAKRYAKQLAEQRAEAEAQLEALRQGRLPAGRLPHQREAGTSIYVHLPGLPVGVHVGKLYTRGLPRTEGEWLWAQGAPTVLGPVLTEASRPPGTRTRKE
jgi:hypothetical protein